MLKRLLKRLKKDRADSIVSAVIVFPVIVAFIITGVDYSVYMANRGQIQGVARDAARTVSIMGGNGTSSLATPIERAYGTSRSEACKQVEDQKSLDKKNEGAGKVVSPASGALTTSSTAIECQVMKGINAQSGLVNVKVKSVKCSPQVATAIGAHVSCEVKWQYNGIPASLLSFINSNGDNTTSGTSESEVRFDSSDLVSR